MIETSSAEEKAKPQEQLADLFEQQLERACVNGCDEEMSESILRLAALFILMKDVSNQSNHFICSCRRIYTLRCCFSKSLLIDEFHLLILIRSNDYEDSYT